MMNATATMKNMEEWTDEINNHLEAARIVALTAAKEYPGFIVTVKSIGALQEATENVV